MKEIVKEEKGEPSFKESKKKLILRLFRDVIVYFNFFLNNLLLLLPKLFVKRLT